MRTEGRRTRGGRGRCWAERLGRPRGGVAAGGVADWAAVTKTLTVARADTLSEIAARNHVAVKDVVALNKTVIKNVNHIEVGQVLVLPVPSASPTERGGDGRGGERDARGFVFAERPGLTDWPGITHGASLGDGHPTEPDAADIAQPTRIADRARQNQLPRRQVSQTASAHQAARRRLMKRQASTVHGRS